MTYETTFSAGNDILLNDVCKHLFDSDCGFYSFDDKFTSFYPFIYQPPPFDEFGWVSLNVMHFVLSLKNVIDLIRTTNESKILTDLLMNRQTYFWIQSSSLIVKIILQIIRLQSLF